MTGSDGPLTIRLRAGTQLAPLAALLALAAAFGYGVLDPGFTEGVRGGGQVTSAILALACLALAAHAGRRLSRPRRHDQVIDAAGVHDSARRRSLPWPEVHVVGYLGNGHDIAVSPFPDSSRLPITLDLTNSDADDGEVLAAIERFARAAGRELELPAPRPR